MGRKGRIALAIVAVACLAWLGNYAGFIARALPNGTGLAAKHLCSLHFVSGLPLERARSLYIDPFVQPLTPVLDVQADDRSITTSALGLGHAAATYRRGYGCTLVHDDESLAPERESLPAAIVDLVDAPHRRATFDIKQLETALDNAFANENKRRNTLAIAVYHDGKLVAERYEQGITQSTPLPGWSMAKSVTATLTGMLVDRGELDVDATGALVEWHASDDPRRAITIDQLLRMTSGLNLAEDHSGDDVNSQMLFREPDGAVFSAVQPLLYPVGSTYDYMSGSTVLASRIVKDATGGNLESSYRWIEDELFLRLTMHQAVLEPDQAGTFIGSSFMLASARDWAQLGQLYLDNGVYNNQRVLSSDWIDYVRRWTPQSGDEAYGAGFWLNAYGENQRRWPEIPADAFWMNGFQSQYVFIIPSERLVIVRLGASTTNPRVRELVGEVIAARK